MNRAELVEQIAEKTGLYKYEVKKFVKAYEDVVVDNLKQGEKIHLHGFLDIEVKDVEAKDYRNPKTGEKSILPATKKVKASASKSLNKII